MWRSTTVITPIYEAIVHPEVTLASSIPPNRGIQRRSAGSRQIYFPVWVLRSLELQGDNISTFTRTPEEHPVLGAGVHHVVKLTDSDSFARRRRGHFGNSAEVR